MGTAWSISHVVWPLQVIFLGLDVIVPLLSGELLKIPKLCRLYFQLLGYLLELFPERMAGLPGDFHHLPSYLQQSPPFPPRHFPSNVILQKLIFYLHPLKPARMLCNTSIFRLVIQMGRKRVRSGCATISGVIKYRTHVGAKTLICLLQAPNLQP